MMENWVMTANEDDTVTLEIDVLVVKFRAPTFRQASDAARLFVWARQNIRSLEEIRWRFSGLKDKLDSMSSFAKSIDHALLSFAKDTGFFEKDSEEKE